MSDLLLWLFKKSDCEQIAHVAFYVKRTLWLFRSQKTSNSLKRFYIFHMFLTVFHNFSPFLCPKANRSCGSLQKSDGHSLQKSDVSDLLFFTSKCFSALMLTKNEHFAQKKFGISPIVPRANNMQMHKI